MQSIAWRWAQSYLLEQKKFVWILKATITKALNKELENDELFVNLV
jgi:hypothetical protein